MCTHTDTEPNQDGEDGNFVLGCEDTIDLHLHRPATENKVVSGKQQKHSKSKVSYKLRKQHNFCYTTDVIRELRYFSKSELQNLLNALCPSVR